MLLACQPELIWSRVPQTHAYISSPPIIASVFHNHLTHLTPKRAVLLVLDIPREWTEHNPVIFDILQYINAT